MRLTIPSFENGAPIPAEFAFGKPGEPVALSDNRNPEIRWSDLPAGTRSLVLICHDPDVPSRPDDVNQPGRRVPADLPRVDFYHWVLVDIPPGRGGIEAGADSDGVVPHGKPIGPTPYGIRGRNDYTGWFAGDPEMEGVYGGYDGPCPPWNDSIVHRYHFTLYALDVPSLGLTGEFGGAEALEAMQGHVLDETVWTGTYTLAADLR